MDDKHKKHEQLYKLLNEKYITRGEYLLSIKENLLLLVDKLKIQEQLNELLEKDYITKDEHSVLIKESLNSTETIKVNIQKEIKNTENHVIDKNIIQRLKNAGNNVFGIYRLIIFEIIISQIYYFLSDVKLEYFKKVNGITENYSEISVVTKFILNSKNIDIIIEKLENLDEFYYIIQFVMFSIFLSYLWNLAKNLKNVDTII